MFGSFRWEGSDQVRVWEASIRIITSASLNEEIQADLFGPFRRDSLVEGPEGFENQTLYFDGIELARNLAFTTSVYWGDRIGGVWTLANLEPSAGLVTIAQLLVDPALPEELRREIQDWLNKTQADIDAYGLEDAIRYSFERKELVRRISDRSFVPGRWCGSRRMARQTPGSR